MLPLFRHLAKFSSRQIFLLYGKVEWNPCVAHNQETYIPLWGTICKKL